MRQIARAAALLLFLLAPVRALALPPVWVVHDRDSTVTLFGSVHLLPQDVTWRPAELGQALQGADDVWFEAPMDAAGQAEASKEAQAHAFLPEGQKLLPMLSAKSRKRLDAVCAKLGLAPTELDGLQPWYAELAISQAIFEKLGVQSSLGVEQQLWSGVRPEARRVALETPAQQIGFFAGAPMKDQLQSLEQTLAEAGDAEHDYQRLLKAWLGADVRMLDREVVQPLRKGAPGLYARVVQQRNERWTDAVVSRLQGSGHTVIIVGMGHLVGPDGLPARLRARGYEVDGPR